MKNFRYVSGAVGMLLCVAILYTRYIPWYRQVQGEKTLACTATTSSLSTTYEEKLMVPEKVACWSDYQNIENEYHDYVVSMHGNIPAWLSGVLLRVGPGQFTLGSTAVEYIYDGFAHLYQFAIKHGAVTYSNAFLKSFYYQTAIKKGEIPSMPAQKSSLFSKIAQLTQTRDPYDNGSVNIAQYGNTCVALTQTPHAIAFNEKTLDTIGPFVYHDALNGHIVTAYPQHDEQTGDIINILTEFGSTSTYWLYRMNPMTGSRIPFAKYATKNPSYIDSFGMTERWCIVPLMPFVVTPRDLLFSSKPFVEHFVWHADKPLEWLLVDKKTGQIHSYIHQPSLFVFGCVNAFETQEHVIVDMLSCPDASLIHTMKRTVAGNPDHTPIDARLTRFCFDIAHHTVTSQVVIPYSLKTVTKNPLMNHKEYTYVYGVTTDRKSIIKHAFKTGQTLTWSKDYVVCGEPLFVPHPQQTTEDDGVILLIAGDIQVQRSCLVVLDARTLEECAYGYLPHAVPSDMHGIFIHDKA